MSDPRQILVQEGLDLMRFQQNYLNRPKPSIQCDVKSIRDRCPNEARYVISSGEKDSFVCYNCLANWIMQLTSNNREVVVRRAK